MGYVVYYNGKYDMDSDGNVFTAYAVFDNYADACASARDYENETGYITTIQEGRE